MNSDPNAPLPPAVIEALQGKLPGTSLEHPDSSIESLPEAPPLAPEFAKPPAAPNSALRPQLFAGEEAAAAIAEGAKRREDAYHALYEWPPGSEAKPLTWSLRRESLWHHLRITLGFPSLQIVVERPEFSALLGDAMIILYLGAHQPAVYEDYRAKPAVLHAAIEEWAETAIPMALRVDAVRLARRIIFDVLDSIPEAVKSAAGKTSGNSQAQ